MVEAEVEVSGYKMRQPVKASCDVRMTLESEAVVASSSLMADVDATVNLSCRGASIAACVYARRPETTRFPYTTIEVVSNKSEVEK